MQLIRVGAVGGLEEQLGQGGAWWAATGAGAETAQLAIHAVSLAGGLLKSPAQAEAGLSQHQSASPRQMAQKEHLRLCPHNTSRGPRPAGNRTLNLLTQTQLCGTFYSWSS